MDRDEPDALTELEVRLVVGGVRKASSYPTDMCASSEAPLLLSPANPAETLVSAVITYKL